MPDVSLGLTKNEGESWYECAIRYARKYGLEEEIKWEYRDCKKLGWSDEEAAWGACWEWDVCDLIRS